jgi:hypothetical protein
MFDERRMFKDVPAILQAILVCRKPVSEAMKIALDYCMEAAPRHERLWSSLAELDYAADVVRLTGWMNTLLENEPPPPDIKGFWFGLYNPSLEDGEEDCQFYCSASERFDPQKPYSDWPCSPKYWPTGRYANSAILTNLFSEVEALDGRESYLGESVLCYAYVGAVVSSWCCGELSQQLTGDDGARAVAFGHDDGDMYFINGPAIVGSQD